MAEKRVALLDAGRQGLDHEGAQPEVEGALQPARERVERPAIQAHEDGVPDGALPLGLLAFEGLDPDGEFAVVLHYLSLLLESNRSLIAEATRGAPSCSAICAHVSLTASRHLRGGIGS